MNTVNELGRRVKLKYPGKYDNLSDAEVGRRVKSQYPGKYDEFIDEVEPSQALTYHEPHHLQSIESPYIEDLIDYYKPSRGVFGSWWQSAKSDSRSKLLNSLNNEQRLVIEQWNILQDSVREGKKTEADFRVFIADKAYQLLTIKHQATLVEQAMATGLPLDDDAEVRKEKLMVDAAVDKHERLTKIDLDNRWKEIEQDLNAADRVQMSELLILDKERRYLEDQIRKRHELQHSKESAQLKIELLSEYDEHIKFLKERISARQAKLLSAENGQNTGADKAAKTNSPANYPTATDADAE